MARGCQFLAPLGYLSYGVIAITMCVPDEERSNSYLRMHLAAMVANNCDFPSATGACGERNAGIPQNQRLRNDLLRSAFPAIKPLRRLPQSRT